MTDNLYVVRVPDELRVKLETWGIKDFPQKIVNTINTFFVDEQKPLVLLVKPGIMLDEARQVIEDNLIKTLPELVGLAEKSSGVNKPTLEQRITKLEQEVFKGKNEPNRKGKSPRTNKNKNTKTS